MAIAEQNSRPITIEELDLSSTKAILPELKPVLDGAYYDSHMYRYLSESIQKAPDPFRLFLARSDGKPVGMAVVYQKIHPNYEYLGFPPVHLKHCTVTPAMRGLKLGKRLADESKRYAFKELGLSVLFGESNEIGALSFYGREGALYYYKSIEEYWRRNSPEQALTYFAADLADLRRREERYPNGSGIYFAFPANQEASERLKAGGFVAIAPK